MGLRINYERRKKFDKACMEKDGDAPVRPYPRGDRPAPFPRLSPHPPTLYRSVSQTLAASIDVCSDSKRKV